MSEQPANLHPRPGTCYDFSLYASGKCLTSMGIVANRFAVGLLLLLTAIAIDAGQPLKPPDTSSPRATMESFLALTEEGTRRIIEYRDAPSPTSQNALEQGRLKVKRILDLSQIPPTARREVGLEAFIFLWDVIARIELPNLEEIPDATAVMKDDDKAKRHSDWQIPDTEITITRVEEGPYTGEFLFSPDTVERAQHFYEMARELPYQRSMPSDDLVRTSQLLTGWMIPMAWACTSVEAIKILRPPSKSLDLGLSKI